MGRFTLTQNECLLLMCTLDADMPQLRKHDITAILEAMYYIVKTGCQWNMLPECYPSPSTVYYHFRAFGQRGVFSRLLKVLVCGRRASMGENPMPEVGILDSESVRSGLPQSVKGIDGHKMTKGIKRHVLTDDLGYPLHIHVSTANVHDSKGGIVVVNRLGRDWPHIREIKADQGYVPCVGHPDLYDADILIWCVKSNFGTSEFIPSEGRWVVERTFSWMGAFRRLSRNYEQSLDVARLMYTVGAVFFMLRYFRP